MINDVPLKTLFDSSKYYYERVKKDDGGSRWYFRKVDPIRNIVNTDEKEKKPKEEKKTTFISLF